MARTHRSRVFYSPFASPFVVKSAATSWFHCLPRRRASVPTSLPPPPLTPLRKPPIFLTCFILFSGSLSGLTFRLKKTQRNRRDASFRRTKLPQVVEFNFLKSQAQEPLATFMEYITYEYMIENVMMLLKGTLSGRDVNELIEQCHPMVSERRRLSLFRALFTFVVVSMLGCHLRN